LTVKSRRVPRRIAMIALVMPTIIVAGSEADQSANLGLLLADVSTEFAKLESHSIRPAEGFIKYDYLVPGGYYGEMWDWDGFFIGCHLAHQNAENARYLRFWALNFTAAIADDGYVAGCITTKGPRPLMGRFAMKPFLAQG